MTSDGKVTLTDFGLVKAGEGTQLTATGMIFGTPEYMSPEQAEGKKLDAQSDIYSLGVVLYEMLAGRAPFVADTTPAVMYKHVHEPPLLEELPSDLPQGVVAVVEKALAKKRGERYQSAGEMAAALQRAMSEAVIEEVEAPPEPVLHPSLTLRLSVKPQTVDVGDEAQWTVTLHNDGDDDLRHVTVRRGRTLLDEPFDLAAGKGRRFTLTTTYKTEGRKTEKVTATGIASTGESVRDEARATVQVTPIPPEPEVPVPPPVVKKPVVEKVAPPLVEPAAVAREEPKPPPRPKRAIFPSLLVIAIGWAIGWAIMVMAFSGDIPWAIALAVGGAIVGLSTGLALRRTEPLVRWNRVLMVVVGWAIDYAIVSIIVDMDIDNIIVLFIVLFIIGAIGGLISGLALWWAELSISWKRVLIVAIGWAIGWVIGWASIFATADAIYETFGWGELIADIIILAICGVICGAIGGGVMFWQLSRARRKA